MRAVRYRETGSIDVLELVDVPDPEPGAADVVVHVEACALNRLDVVQRNGWYALPGFTFPHIPGMDVAGTIVATGDAVTELTAGDRVVIDPSLAGVDDASKLAGRGDLHGELGVIGANADGGYAELCLAPASHAFRVPDHVSIERAASFPTCYLTACHALFEVGRLTSGETVMIHAAASGVSVAAIQLAVRQGATVLATAGSEAKLEAASRLGADHVLNNRTGDIAVWARDVTDGRGVDMVFDHVGTALFAPSVFSLAIGGRLVTCGNTSGDEATIPSLGFLFHSAAKILGSGPYAPAEFGPAWERFCAGEYEVPIHAEHDLADAAAAHAQLESGEVIGKVLLRP